MRRLGQGQHEGKEMPGTGRGAGVIFYDRPHQRVLVYRRDDKPSIPFPGQLDLLGGHTEEGETPEQTVVREIGEELEDRRTGKPFVLAGHRLFTVYTDVRGVTDYVFCAEADFELTDVSLKEGQGLVWVTEDDVKRTYFAFGYNVILTTFFQALRDGTV